MKRTLSLIALAAVLSAVSCARQDFCEKVDPLIGSGFTGHVFVGANVPYGMVQAGPTSIPQLWNWTSGYHASDSTVIGFSQTHLSGTGIGDLFDVTLMPVTGEVTYARGTEDDPGSGMWSYGDRSREIARPGYYAIPLERYGILAEMTATCRTSLYRYTFPASDEAAVVIDLENGGCWDSLTDAAMEAHGDRTIVGHRFSTGWASDQKVYFAAEFSKPFSSLTFHGRDNAYGRVSFSTRRGEKVLVKVGISPTSVEAAIANMKAEIPGWNFEKVRRSAEAAWNSELSRIVAESSIADVPEIFYTALYHTMILPVTFTDASERNRRYSIFSLWDTYRAKMPLFCIINPRMMGDIVSSMLDICDRQGRLPVWHLWGCENNCMVGNPAIPVVSEAIVKGIEGFDRERAWDAIEKTAYHPGRGGDVRNSFGFLPWDKFSNGGKFSESVSFDMEYAIADGAAAKAAKALGKEDRAAVYERRSRSWRNYYDPETGFVRAKDSKGEFRTPFNPILSTYTNDYTEGNAWQYTFLVPQDLDGLVSLAGGREATIEKLDGLFAADEHLDGGDALVVDISGLIGQYVHGNEPSHHIIYFYTLLGRPDRTAELVRQVCTTLYTTGREGLCGNEDAGQMSAWYVFSALGFYPVEPASGDYVFGSPLVDRAEIPLPGRRKLTIVAHDNSAENIYIREVRVNGEPHSALTISYDEIMAGGTLEYFMSSTPSTSHPERM